MSQNNHLAMPIPEIVPFISAIEPAPQGYLDKALPIREEYERPFIELYRTVQRPRLPAEGVLIVSDHTVPVDGGTIAVRAYYPVGLTGHETYPLLAWAHGGGYVFGSLETDDYLCRILAAEFNITVVNIEYRLAPTHPFPAQHNDTYAALKWIVLNKSILRADLKQGFIIAGMSAGGTVMGALVHRAVSDPFFYTHGSVITGLVLQMPILVHPDGIPENIRSKFSSFDQNMDAPILSTKQLYEMFEKAQTPPTDPNCFGLLHPDASFLKLPPTYMQICGMDPGCDGAMIYAAKLENLGVPTRIDVYAGVPHGFHMVFPTARYADKIDADLKKGLKWLLARTRDFG